MTEVKDIVVLDDAADDMVDGREFYEFQEKRLGQYFWDCILSDIESLIIYAGVHQRHFGLYRLLSRRFPYAIYYEVTESIVYVISVLPMRTSPERIMRRLNEHR